MHTSGEWLEQEYYLPIVKRDPQAAGSAITYARRYALQSIAGIPTADDDAESAMLRGSQVSEKLSQDQINDIKGLLEETNTDVKKFLEHFKSKSVDDMLVVQYSRAMAALTSKLK